MNRSLVLILGALLAALLPLVGCYRLEPPAELGQDVRVEITVNNARMVRSQAYLQSAVAGALASQLGWHVSPNGSAKLQLTIDEEDISSSGTDWRDTPNRWTIRLHGQILLTSRHASELGTWTGTGYASALTSTRDDEPSALRNAAENAASTIATWLEARMRLRTHGATAAPQSAP
jgi:hypothetical protein